MARSIATLAVSVTARTGKFNKGMAGAGRRVGAFASAVGRAGKRAAVFGGFVAGSLTAGLVVLTKRSFASADALGKTADKLGITTEALGGLRHAANITGVTNDGFDKGLQRMIRSVSESADGVSEASEAFDNLGIDVKKLNKLSPEKQFMSIADAMESIANQNDRVRIAFEIFGRQGVNLLNTLKGGSVSILALMRDAERLGLTLTRQQVKLVEEANDAWTRLKAVMTGVGNNIAVNLAPFLTEAIKKIVTMGTDGETMGVKIKNAFQSASIFSAAFLDNISMLAVGFHAVRAAIAAVTSGLAGLGAEVNEAKPRLLQAGAGVQALLLGSAAKLTGSKRLASLAAAARAVTIGLGNAPNKGADGFRSLEQAAREEFEKSIKAMEDAMNSAASGGSANKMFKFLEELENKLNAATQAAMGLGGASGAITAGGPKFAQQFTRDSVLAAASMAGAVQTTTLKQLREQEKTNTILERIAANTLLRPVLVN